MDKLQGCAFVLEGVFHISLPVLETKVFTKESPFRGLVVEDFVEILATQALRMPNTSLLKDPKQVKALLTGMGMGDRKMRTYLSLSQEIILVYRESRHKLLCLLPLEYEDQYLLFRIRLFLTASAKISRAVKLPTLMVLTGSPPSLSTWSSPQLHAEA